MHLTQRISQMADAIKIDRMLEIGSLIIGMHVRHGDACNQDEMARAHRSCTPLYRYMEAARSLAKSARLEQLKRRMQPSHQEKEGRYGAGLGDAFFYMNMQISNVTIYLATDSADVIQESLNYQREFHIVHMPESAVSRHSSQCVSC